MIQHPLTDKGIGSSRPTGRRREGPPPRASRERAADRSLRPAERRDRRPRRPRRSRPARAALPRRCLPGLDPARPIDVRVSCCDTRRSRRVRRTPTLGVPISIGKRDSGRDPRRAARGAGPRLATDAMHADRVRGCHRRSAVPVDATRSAAYAPVPHTHRRRGSDSAPVRPSPRSVEADPSPQVTPTPMLRTVPTRSAPAIAAPAAASRGSGSPASPRSTS